MFYLRAFIFAIALIAISSSAHAYVGPGAGISLIGALIGVVVAVITAFWILLSAPIKKMLKKNKSAENTENEEAADNAAEPKKEDGAE